jgi:nucleotide-binding universal stress UspA family protein
MATIPAPIANKAAPHANTVPAPEGLLVAAEGGLGLRALARSAMRLVAPTASLRLVAVTGDPRTLFPLVALHPDEWLDAHKAIVASSRAALDSASRQLVDPTRTLETSVLDLSTQTESAPHAVGALAAEMDASLIAVTAFGRGERGRGVWRVDPEELAATGACPVLYVPYVCLEEGRTRMARILVAVDGSVNACDALAYIIDHAPQSATIRVVYVVDHVLGLRNTPRITGLMKEGMRVLTSANTQLKEHGRTGETTLVGTSMSARSVADVIGLEAQRWHADLVVLGSRGRSPLTRWLLGSVAEHALRGAKQPVLIVPAFEQRAALREVNAELSAEKEAALQNVVDLPPIFL